MFTQQVSDKSYALIEARLGWARGKISLLDGACGKVGKVVSPAILTTDKYIDGTVDALSTRVLAVRVSVSGKVAPVHARLVQFQGSLARRGLHLVDSSESLIDRLLPLPAEALKGKTEEEDGQRVSSLYRVARLPFVVPLRVTMVIYVKTNGALETVVLSGRQVANVAWDKQTKFAKQVMERTKPLIDKVGSATKPITDYAQASKAFAGKRLANSRQIITVRINNLVVRLHLVEVKDWSIGKASDIKQDTSSICMAVASVAHRAIACVIGHRRAAAMLSNLPVDEDHKLRVGSHSTESQKEVGAKADAKTAPIVEVEQPRAHSDNSSNVTSMGQLVLRLSLQNKLEVTLV